MTRHGRFFALWTAFLFSFSSAALAADPASLVSKEPEPKPALVKQVQGPKVQPIIKKAVKKPMIVLPTMSEEEAEAEGEIKTLKGRVSGVNNFGVAVEYGGGTREMWADLMKETKLQGVSKFRDLGTGDTVELTYKELKTSSKKLLQKVRLVQRKPQEIDDLQTEAASE